MHAPLLVVGGGGAHALLDLAGHGQEGLLDVARVLGRSLKERNTQAVSEFLWGRNGLVISHLKTRGVRE